MHRNTFFLVLLLSVIAALLVGVNIGRTFRPTADITASVTPTPSPQPSQPTVFTSQCRITVILPAGATVAQEATDGAQFVNPDATVVFLGCQKDIPRPAIPAEKIETLQIASISAKLYHTASAKDGTPSDALIFRHPTTAKDIYLAGFGSTFSAIISSIEVLK